MVSDPMVQARIAAKRQQKDLRRLNRRQGSA
jgi:hypothetical protein